MAIAYEDQIKWKKWASYLLADVVALTHNDFGDVDIFLAPVIKENDYEHVYGAEPIQLYSRVGGVLGQYVINADRAQPLADIRTVNWKPTFLHQIVQASEPLPMKDGMFVQFSMSIYDIEDLLQQIVRDYYIQREEWKYFRYRFSIHYSLLGGMKGLTVNIRRVGGKNRYITVQDEAENRTLNMISDGGLILVGGQYGHGKTTFVYHVLSKWMEKRKARSFIITLEDPVEGILPPPAKQIEVNPSMWEEYLKAVMREKPDVVFIGEILTPKMAEVMMQYASTGMSVIATIHASSTPYIFTRLKSLLRSAGDPSPELTIATAIKGTIYVELKARSGGRALQLYEVVDWKKAYPNINAFAEFIRQNALESAFFANLLDEGNLNKEAIYPLYTSALMHGLDDYGKKIINRMKKIVGLYSEDKGGKGL